MSYIVLKIFMNCSSGIGLPVILKSCWEVTICTPDLGLNGFVDLGSPCLLKHTYLAQGLPWSRRRCPQSEALPLHSGLADLCDHPKCGWLGCVIYGRGGLRSRYPLKIQWKLWISKSLVTLTSQSTSVFFFHFVVKRQSWSVNKA